MVPDDESGPDTPSIAPPSVRLGLRRRSRTPGTPGAPDSPPAGSPPAGATPRPPTIFDVARPAAPAPAPQAAPRAAPQAAPQPVTEPDAVTWTPPPMPLPPRPAPAPAPATSATSATAISTAEPASGPGPRRPQPPTWLGPRTGAVVVGLVVGLLLVLATGLILRGCEAVRGTASCGGGAGFFLLLAVLVLAGLLGTLLLRAIGTPQPGGTSVLAVGLTAVVVLLFLGGQLFAWWTVLAVPLVAAGAFGLSHWVTTAFDDDGAADRAGRDDATGRPDAPVADGRVR